MNFLTALLTSTPSVPEITFQPEKFVDMLGYMGKGMLVIFVIIGAIILATLVINKFFSGKNQ